MIRQDLELPLRRSMEKPSIGGGSGLPSLHTFV